MLEPKYKIPTMFLNNTMNLLIDFPSWILMFGQDLGYILINKGRGTLENCTQYADNQRDRLHEKLW